MTKLKKAVQYLLMLTCICGVFACSDDEDTTAPSVNDIAGTYTGYHEMSSQYFSGMYGINDTINITANDDGTATVVFNNDSWETTLTNVIVTAEENGYKLSGSGKMSMAGMSGKKADYDCTFEGTISKDKSSCNLVFTLPSVMQGTTITFTTGEVPAAKYLADSYDGWVKMAMAYAPDGINYDGQSITITANEDGTVNVVYSSTDLGEATISNVAVTKDGDSYKLEGEGTMLMGMSEKKSEYACQLSGTISADKETYSIVLTLPSVMQGTTITFTNGSAPAAE